MNAHVLLCSMVYQPHSFPPSISSFIIEIAFAIIWATGTRLAFAMFRSGTTSVRTSEIGKYPDGILPQHGLWTMDYETFSALLAICVGKSPVIGEFPAQRPVTRSFDVSFDLRLNKQLSKQSWGWQFETPSCTLWRLCNAENNYVAYKTIYVAHYFHDIIVLRVNFMHLHFSYEFDFWVNFGPLTRLYDELICAK